MQSTEQAISDEFLQNNGPQQPAPEYYDNTQQPTPEYYNSPQQHIPEHNIDQFPLAQTDQFSPENSPNEQHEIDDRFDQVEQVQNGEGKRSPPIHTYSNPFERRETNDLSISYIYPQGDAEGVNRRDSLNPGTQIFDCAQDTFDFKGIGNELVFKGDYEDSAWLSDSVYYGKGRGSGEWTPEEEAEYRESNLARKRATSMRHQNHTAPIVKGTNQRPREHGVNESRSLTSSMSQSQAGNTSMVWDDRVFQIVEGRKKESLMRLKKWEEARVKVINEHRMICEHLFIVMKRKIVTSKSGFKGFVEFFLERIRQEQTIARTVMRNTPKLLGLFEESKLTPGVGPLCKILQAGDTYHQQHVEKSNIMAQFIETSIVQDILMREEKRYNGSMDPIFENFRSIKRSLNKENEKATRIAQEYIELYRRSLAFKKTKEDLFIMEMRFLKQTQLQLNLQRQLGQCTAKLIKEMHLNETMRFENLRNAFKIYIQKMNGLHRSSEDPEVLALLDIFDSKAEMDATFALSKILGKEDITILEEIFPTISEPTAEELSLYLNSLCYPELGPDPLIFCDSKSPVEVDAQLLGDLNSHVAITADANLIVYNLDYETRDYKVYRELKVGSLVIEKEVGRLNVLEFTESKKKFLIGTDVLHYKITLHNNPEKLHFLQIIELLSGQDYEL